MRSPSAWAIYGPEGRAYGGLLELFADGNCEAGHGGGVRAMLGLGRKQGRSAGLQDERTGEAFMICLATRPRTRELTVKWTKIALLSLVALGWVVFCVAGAFGLVGHDHPWPAALLGSAVMIGGIWLACREWERQNPYLVGHLCRARFPLCGDGGDAPHFTIAGKDEPATDARDVMIAIYGARREGGYVHDGYPACPDCDYSSIYRSSGSPPGVPRETGAAE